MIDNTKIQTRYQLAGWMHRHSVVQLQNTKNKDKSLKTTREKGRIAYKVMAVGMIADFQQQLDNLKDRRIISLKG